MISTDFYDEDIWQAYSDRYNAKEEYLGNEKEINQKDPLVSVCVVTFNHENFIEKCIDSIIAQKTDFTFEILIGEDGSKDNTRTILKEYANRHPDLIRLFLRDTKTSHFYDKNGKKEFNFNHKWTRSSAKGTFIALCDGDDYWIDDEKLQKQVNFLQSNRDFSLCFHNAKVINSTKKKSHLFNNIQEGEYAGVDIFKRWLVPTSSAVFRKEHIRDIRHVFNKNFFFGDIVLFLTLAERGRMWYVDEVMSVYRRHEEGLSIKKMKDINNLRKFAKHQKEIINTFGDSYKNTAYRNISWVYFLLFKRTLRTNIIDSFLALVRSFYYSRRVATKMTVDFIKKRLHR